MLCLKGRSVFHPFCMENTALCAVETSLPIHIHQHLVTANESVLLFSYSGFVLMSKCCIVVDAPATYVCVRVHEAYVYFFIYLFFLASSFQSKLKGRGFYGICCRHQIMVNMFGAWHPFAS